MRMFLNDPDVQVLLGLTVLGAGVPLALLYALPSKYRVRALYAVAIIFFMVGAGLVIAGIKSLSEPAGDISYAIFTALSVPAFLVAFVLALAAWLSSEVF